MGKNDDSDWVDVGVAADLSQQPVQQVMVGAVRIALTFRDGVFGAIHGACNHAGGPLGKGTLEGDYIVCPWHQWRFHRIGGQGERGFEEDVVPAYRVRVSVLCRHHRRIWLRTPCWRRAGSARAETTSLPWGAA